MKSWIFALIPAAYALMHYVGVVSDLVYFIGGVVTTLACCLVHAVMPGGSMDFEKE